MKKIKYMLKRICSMNYSELFKTAKRVSKKCNKNCLIIFIDIIYCGMKYMAGYVDYEVFEMYNMNKEQRKTVITRGINNKFVVMLNDKNFTNIIDDKILFNKKYNDYLHRDWLDLRVTTKEDFLEYMKSKKVAIVKPIDLSCGKGVEKIVCIETIDKSTIMEFLKNNSGFKITEEMEGLEAEELVKYLLNTFGIHFVTENELLSLYDELQKNRQYLVEDYVMQHKDLMKLYPEAVNTLRIVTILKDNVAYVPFACIRMGNLGNVVDNFNHGGLLTTIDEDGIIRKPGVDKNGNVYEKHPYTGTDIVGFKIPLYDEAINYVKELAKVTPQVRYTAWDICVTDNGPVVIEGNPFPGHDVYQSKVHLNEGGKGMLPTFEKIIYG